MKKIISILTLTIILICSAFTMLGCGDSEKNARDKGLQYKKTSDGIYLVNGFNGDAPENGIIDVSSLNTGDVQIEEIGEEVFKGLKGVEKIIIPNTVKKIGVGAFSEMPNLKELVVPFIGATPNGGKGGVGDTPAAEDKATDVERTIYHWFGKEEFAGGSKIEKVKFSNTASEETYYLPEHLEKITINPANDYIIPAYAFYNCKVIKTLRVNANIQETGVMSLYNCLKLSAIQYENVDGEQRGVVIDETTRAYDKNNENPQYAQDAKDFIEKFIKGNGKVELLEILI